MPPVTNYNDAIKEGYGYKHVLKFELDGTTLDWHERLTKKGKVA